MGAYLQDIAVDGLLDLWHHHRPQWVLWRSPEHLLITAALRAYFLLCFSCQLHGDVRGEGMFWGILPSIGHHFQYSFYGWPDMTS